MGCKILFTIRYGDADVVVPMETDLSSGQSTYEAIAKELIKDKNQEIRQTLLDTLKKRTKGRTLTREEINEKGIVPNSIVANLAKRYPNLDWGEVDQNIDLLQSDWFEYYGTSISNCIIDTLGENGEVRKVFVIDPTDYQQVNKLHQYLLTKSRLESQSQKVQDIIKESEIEQILKQLPERIQKMDKDLKALAKLDQKGFDKLTPSQKERYIQLSKVKAQYDSLTKYVPTDAVSLLLDYMENIDKYQGLKFKTNEGALMNMSTEFKNIIKLIQDKKVREAFYNDVLANEIVSNSVWDKNKNMHKISKADFISSLYTKLEDIEEKMKPLEMDSPERNKLVKVRDEIKKYLNSSQTPKGTKNIVEFLITETDDEFSYQFDSQTGGVIYFKNVPRTMEQQDTEFYQKLKILKPVEPYRGFNIYINPETKEYHFSRHILTTQSYGNKYKTVEECKQAIDSRVKGSSISQQNLIEFKLRGDRDVVYLPNKFLPRQVIKSLRMTFNQGLLINDNEKDLIFSSGINNSNNLEQFYKYVEGLLTRDTTIVKRNDIKNALRKHINTAEKAACFIYAMNEMFTNLRTALSSEKITSIIDRIVKAEDEGRGYDYFVVEEVSDTSNSNLSNNFTKYYSIRKSNGENQRVLKPTYKTVLTKVTTEIHNNIIETDESTNRLGPSIQILTDISEKLQEKLGVKVNILTNSELEEKFKEWNIEEIPINTRGFVRGGEIFINASTATQTDMFHEYSHLALAVLKAQNYENYRNLVDLVANNEKSKYIKEVLRERYKYLAEEDLNEEVFAYQFGKYMTGRDFGAFLNTEFNYASKAVVDDMENIFGAGSIKAHWDEFKNARISDIIRQFSFDLRLKMNEGNGLEIEQGRIFRQATSWIEDQIKEYETSEDKNVGIFKDCK